MKKSATRRTYESSKQHAGIIYRHGRRTVRFVLARSAKIFKERGVKFILKTEQEKALLHLFHEKDGLAILPTGFGFKRC